MTREPKWDNNSRELRGRMTNEPFERPSLSLQFASTADNGQRSHVCAGWKEKSSNSQQQQTTVLFHCAPPQTESELKQKHLLHCLKCVYCLWMQVQLNPETGIKKKTNTHDTHSLQLYSILLRLTRGAPGVSRTRSGSSWSNLSKEFSMSLQDRTVPHRSASSLEVSSRWLVLASRASDTASEGTPLRMGPRFSSASSSLMQKQTIHHIRIKAAFRIYNCYF